MSSSQRGPSTGHYSSHHSMGNSTHDAEATNRIRYMAHMERRARPPTFRPLTIVVVVLSIGLFVIGLIMIVIAHWPGVSAGDSLKIAGGVLMAVGGVVFIIAMIVTCVLKNREKDRFEKSIASLQASRRGPQYGSSAGKYRYNSSGNMSVISRPTIQTTPTPSIDAKPGKSILKKTPSTSTYGTNRGSVFGEESFGQNHSYEPESEGSDNSSAGKYEVYRIETLPDPTGARKARGQNGAVPQRGQSPLAGSGLAGSGLGGTGGMISPGIMDHSSTDSEAQVPTAVRSVTKKRRGQSPSVASAGRQNLSYSHEGEVEAPTPANYNQQPRGNGRKMQSYSNDYGYDMYEGDQQKPPRPAEGETPSSEAREKRRQRRAQKQAEAMQDAGASGGGAPPRYDQSGGAAFQNEAFQPQEADLGFPEMQTVTTTTTRTTRQTRATRPQHNTSQGSYMNTSQLNSSMEDELRINIKAEPGTAVHITPSGTHAYRPQRTVASPSQSSVETEI